MNNGFTWGKWILFWKCFVMILRETNVLYYPRFRGEFILVIYLNSVKVCGNRMETKRWRQKIDENLPAKFGSCGWNIPAFAKNSNDKCGGTNPGAMCNWLHSTRKWKTTKIMINKSENSYRVSQIPRTEINKSAVLSKQTNSDKPPLKLLRCLKFPNQRPFNTISSLSSLSSIDLKTKRKKKKNYR